MVFCTTLLTIGIRPELTGALAGSAPFWIVYARLVTTVTPQASSLAVGDSPGSPKAIHRSASAAGCIRGWPLPSL